MSSITYNWVSKDELAEWLLLNTSLKICDSRSLEVVRRDWDNGFKGYSENIKNDSCSGWRDSYFKSERAWEEWMEPEKSKYLVITDENWRKRNGQPRTSLTGLICTEQATSPCNSPESIRLSYHCTPRGSQSPPPTDPELLRFLTFQLLEACPQDKFWLRTELDPKTLPSSMENVREIFRFLSYVSGAKTIYVIINDLKHIQSPEPRSLHILEELMENQIEDREAGIETGPVLKLLVSNWSHEQAVLVPACEFRRVYDVDTRAELDLGR